MTAPDNYGTPLHIFDPLNAEFGFTLDPCAEPWSAKCEKYYTKEDDGLSRCWQGETVFCNPPYGQYQTEKWVRKAVSEWLKGETTIVLLIPAKTGAVYFHDCVFDLQKVTDKIETRWLKSRIRFIDPETREVAKGTGWFSSVVVVYHAL